MTAPTPTTAHLYGSAEQQRDEVPGADHLREHVEEHREDAADGAATRTGACRSRNATTSANVNLPRLRSGSAIRNISAGQPTSHPVA